MNSFIIASIITIIFIVFISTAKSYFKDQVDESEALDTGLYELHFKKEEMIGTILPESDIQSLTYYKNYLVAFVIIGVEDELFDDVEAAKRYATSHNLYQHLGYAIIARLLIAPSSTDYTSDEVVQRGEVVEFEEYLRFDKQLNVWKKMIKALELDRITYQACLDLLKETNETVFNVVNELNYTALLKRLPDIRGFYGVPKERIDAEIVSILKVHDLSNRQIKSLSFMLEKLLVR